MKSNRTLLSFRTILAVACIALSACAGTKTSTHTLNDSYKVNQPTKSDGCYDAAVLLGKNLADSKVIANKVLTAIDAKPSSETDTHINAQRNRHIGVVVGSGGEELLLTFKSATSETTFVTAATKTGFVGGAGQKAWSCEIVDQMAAMASKPTN